MINIVFIIDRIWDPYGGTEKQLLLLLENIDRKQFSPHLICLVSTPWLESAELPCPVTVLGLKSLKSLMFIKAVFKFRRYCRDNSVDIVQTFFQDANLFGTIAAFVSRIRVIVSSRRNLGQGYWHNRFWIFILRLLRRVTTHYVSNSATVADYTVSREKVAREKISVIYNGLVFDRFKAITPELRNSQRIKLGVGPGDILVGAVANLRPVKNLTLFVEVARRVYGKYDNTRFVIIGEGPDRVELQQMISDFGLTNVMSLAGQQSDVIPCLSAMDIAVLCSKAESLSNSIIEYMAAGLPCVVSDVGGNAEAVGYDKGLVFDVRSKDDFFAKLETLIVDPQLRSELGRSARSYAKSTFDLGPSVRQHELLYKKLNNSG